MTGTMDKQAAQGSLKITCTVSSSVGLVHGSDGEMHLIVANVGNSTDNASHLRYVQLKNSEERNANKARSIPKKKVDTEAQSKALAR
jgi:hypothetical protein